MKKKLFWILLILLLLILLPFVPLFFFSEEPAETSADIEVSSAESSGDLTLSYKNTEKNSASSSKKAFTVQAVSAEKTDTLKPKLRTNSRRAEQAKRSSFRIYDESSGKVLTVSDREALIGMLACEMTPDTPPEALKAQAVAAYTNCCKLRQDRMKSGSQKYHGADFDANPAIWLRCTTKEQMRLLWGKRYPAHRKKLEKAADEVLGQVLHYDGVLIFAPYFAVSSGKTESSRDIWGGDEPYLSSVESPWDKNSPDHKTRKAVQKEDLCKIVRQSYPEIRFPENANTWIRDIKRTKAGSVKTICIGGEILDGVEVRNLFDLPSSNFTVRYQKGVFLFTCLGRGHGVGMSQYGAAAMAKEGRTYEEILNWYYPGTVLCK